MDKLPGGKTWLDRPQGRRPDVQGPGRGDERLDVPGPDRGGRHGRQSTLTDKGTATVDGVQTRHIQMVVPKAVLVEQAKKGLEAMSGHSPLTRSRRRWTPSTSPSRRTPPRTTTLTRAPRSRSRSPSRPPSTASRPDDDEVHLGASVSIVKPDPATVATFAELMSQAGGWAPPPVQTRRAGTSTGRGGYGRPALPIWSGPAASTTLTLDQ